VFVKVKGPQIPGVAPDSKNLQSEDLCIAFLPLLCDPAFLPFFPLSLFVELFVAVPRRRLNQQEIPKPQSSPLMHKKAVHFAPHHLHLSPPPPLLLKHLLGSRASTHSFPLFENLETVKQKGKDESYASGALRWGCFEAALPRKGCSRAAAFFAGNINHPKFPMECLCLPILSPLLLGHGAVVPRPPAHFLTVQGASGISPSSLGNVDNSQLWKVLLVQISNHRTAMHYQNLEDMPTNRHLLCPLLESAFLAVQDACAASPSFAGNVDDAPTFHCRFRSPFVFSSCHHYLVWWRFKTWSSHSASCAARPRSSLLI
jgi:hypothetical protein